MTILQLQVNLFCEEPEACLRFYEALGGTEAFRTPREGEPEHLEVEFAGVRIGLTNATVANAIAALGVSPGAAPAAEIALWVDDVEAYFDRALAAGGSAVTPPMDSPDGRLRYGWLRDPEGHQLKLIQQR